ncbi:hypothetical protein ACGF1Z_24880 [Streptomyces sp. NPDC048018]|uniref:hypothetical protein n=1 Tax=Streptomyces sp. NPDC048018 TaxID=3365499 RepID=UPI00371DB888
MPGSTTLGPGHGVDAIAHPDAQRMTAVMRELHRLLTTTDPERITHAQVTALCGGDAHRRMEFTAWVERMAHQLERATA